MMRSIERFEIDSLKDAIKEFGEYIGTGIQVEQVGENRLMVTVPEC